MSSGICRDCGFDSKRDAWVMRHHLCSMELFMERTQAGLDADRKAQEASDAQYRRVLANFMLPDGMTLDDIDNPITHDYQSQYQDAVEANK